MMRRFMALAVACAVLAACDLFPPAPAPEAPAPDPGPLAESQALAAPDPATRRYIGAWAVDRRICANPAWRFGADQITTSGEVHCDFTSVREVEGGYAIAASCTAEAPPEPYEIQLALGDPEQGMTLSGGPWGAPVRLVRCGQ